MGSRVLVIGGTGFIGRHLIDACVYFGHEVTVLNRDNRPSKSPASMAHLIGDRRRAQPRLIAALAAGWDAVIDTCAYTVEDMQISRHIPARRYLMLSTCAVYRADGLTQIADEQVPVDGEGPGRGKVDCEREASALPAESLIVRLGVVTGRGDPSARLTYWVERCLRELDVLVPADPEQPVQLVDVRDVAVFLAHAVESGQSGVVNVAGPVMGFDEMLRLVQTSTDSRARLRWIPEPTVLEHGVRPWSQVPLWLPTDHPYRAHMRTGATRAIHGGFAPRPPAATIEDVTRWYRTSRTWHSDWLTLDQERSVLALAG